MPTSDCSVRVHLSAEVEELIESLRRDDETTTQVAQRLVSALPEMLKALDVARMEIEAWRTGLNTRSALKNLNEAKVGACFGGPIFIGAAIRKASGELPL